MNGIAQHLPALQVIVPLLSAPLSASLTVFPPCIENQMRPRNVS